MDNAEAASQNEPRPEKVAVVAEVRERLSGSSAVLVTEYRGIDVAGMATLRRSLREAGGQYKIYKNTLVRRATGELGLELDEFLTGPTAIAFVPEGGDGDPVTVAKALKAFGRDHPELVIKGGMLGEQILSAADAKALADVPPRDELLARLAGDMIAPLQRFAGLLQAVPREFATAVQALADKGGAAPSSETQDQQEEPAEPAGAGGQTAATEADDVEEEPPAQAEGDATEES